MAKKQNSDLTESGSSAKRNLYVHIEPENKEALKQLAKASGLSLDLYVSAVLTEAIKQQDKFKTLFVKDVALAS